jgi:hypothetical protein
MNVPHLEKILHHFPRIESLKVPLPYPIFLDYLKSAELIGQCQSLRSLSIDGKTEHRSLMYEGVLILIADGCLSLQCIHLGNYIQIDKVIQN